MDEITYSLRHKETDQLINVSGTRNSDATEAVDVTYNFARSGQQPWIVKSPIHAEFCRTHDTPWYNAGYETPMHNGIDMDEYSVVKIVTTVIPASFDPITDRDVAIAKYGPNGLYPNERHLEETLKYIESGMDVGFSLYDYIEVRAQLEKDNV